MSLSITQLCQKYGVSVETIRYYERIGLIPNVPRNEHGNRYYDSDLQQWFEMIVCLRHSGVAVKVLQQYVAMIKKGDATLKQREELLREQEQALLDKRANLNKSIHRLRHKINLYASGEIKNNRSYYEEYGIEREIKNKLH